MHEAEAEAEAEAENSRNINAPLGPAEPASALIAPKRQLGLRLLYSFHVVFHNMQHDLQWCSQSHAHAIYIAVGHRRLC